MEWVETTGKTIEEATEQALDRLGVDVDEVDIEVLEEPKNGLFGKTRGEARIRARVKPAEVRPKVDRRRSRDRKAPRSGEAKVSADTDNSRQDKSGSGDRSAGGRGRSGGRSQDRRPPREERSGDPVDPALVGEAAVSFMEGLTSAFGFEATVELQREDTDLEVTVNGSELGLMVGHGGRTLVAIQDLVRVAAQRRLGDHDTHLRVDIAKYRERRRASLEAFAKQIAERVKESGRAVAVDPMSSADRKVLHDVLAEIEGVSSRSEGEDPDRRVLVSPE
jgi:spoIIIJ-associated protein